MTTQSPPDRSAVVATLAEQLPRMMRVLHGLKNQMAADARDRAALVLLFPLARLGPLRQTALAELVHADPSTVSRHVAALVDEGLVRRIADEHDGRATRLLVTAAGHEALEDLRRERESHLRAVTADWSATDLATLAGLFGRLLDGLAAGLPAVPPSRPSSRSPKDPA